MPIIPVRVSDEEMEILKALAKFENVSVSALIRNATFKKLEDQYDIKIAE